MNQHQDETSTMRRFTNEKKLHEYRLGMGTVFSQEEILSNNPKVQQVLNKYCRIYLKDGTIMEGEFNKGSCERALFYSNYLKGWIEGKCDGRLEINGKGQEMNQRGELEYEGEFQWNFRHGSGVEYLVGFTLTGNWKAGRKQGPFTEISEDCSQKGVGEFDGIKKIGKWVITDNNRQFNVDYQRLEKSSIIKNIQQSSLKNDYQRQNHRSLMTQASFQRINDSARMLDDSTLSAWAVLLQHYLSSIGNINTIVFPLELIKEYAGIDLKKRDYHKVRHMSKHLSGYFSLFAPSPNGLQKIVLFPIIYNAHYTLAVVRINHKQQLTINCCIFDSLNYSYYSNVAKYTQKNNSTWSAIHDYLIHQFTDKYPSIPYHQQNTLKLIQEMDLKYQKCARQQDGYSCGVFVCIFMYYLIIGKHKQVQQQINLNTLKLFRKECLSKLLNQESVAKEEIQSIQTTMGQKSNGGKPRQYNMTVI